MSDRFQDPLAVNLQTQALSLPEVTETGACVKRAFKIKKKGFLYLGEKPGTEISVMVKLGPSIPEAETLAQSRSEITVGKGRWVTVKLAPGSDLGNGVLEGWLCESYCEQAPKTLAKQVLEEQA